MHPKFAQRLRKQNAVSQHLGSTFDPEQNSIETPDIAPDDAYSDALELIAPNVTENIAQQQSGGETWMDTLQRMLPQLSASDPQLLALQAQLRQAQQGLPPLDPSSFAITNDATGATTAVIPKAWVWIGGALLAYHFLTSHRR